MQLILPTEISELIFLKWNSFPTWVRNIEQAKSEAFNFNWLDFMIIKYYSQLSLFLLPSEIPIIGCS